MRRTAAALSILHVFALVATSAMPLCVSDGHRLYEWSEQGCCESDGCETCETETEGECEECEHPVTTPHLEAPPSCGDCTDSLAPVGSGRITTLQADIPNEVPAALVAVVAEAAPAAPAWSGVRSPHVPAPLRC